MAAASSVRFYYCRLARELVERGVQEFDSTALLLLLLFAAAALRFCTLGDTKNRDSSLRMFDDEEQQACVEEQSFACGFLGRMPPPPFMLNVCKLMHDCGCEMHEMLNAFINLSREKKKMS